MSSRSIGVTNVWLRRWMMSWVIRSPSCSQIRISLASSLRSGYSLRSSSRRAAARRMFPPASSNRSKNSRSRGARTFARRTGGTLALVHVEPGQLQTAGGQLRDPLPGRRGGRLPVIFHAPVLHAVTVDHRVGGAMVAVPGQSDAARVYQLDPGGAGADERKVRVAEHDPRRLDAHEELGIELGRLREEALHVVLRRGVAVERAVDGRRLWEAEQLLDELLAERFRTAGADVGDRSRRVVPVDEPAVGVAADPGRVRQLLQALDRLLRPSAGHRVVAAEEELVEIARVGENGLERRQVAVDVVEQ